MPGRMTVDYYTDPFCSWSFAAEAAVERFRQEWTSRVDFRCRMLPILDRLNAKPNPEARVSTPKEMMDEWKKVSAITGVAIDPELWAEDPPQSTWPACLAVKASERQGVRACARFLKNLRVHIMQQRKNGSRPEVMQEVADGVDVDGVRLIHDLTQYRDELEREILEDIWHAESNCVESTPSLLIRSSIGDKILISGPRDYSLYRQAAATLYAEQLEHEERMAESASQ